MLTVMTVVAAGFAVGWWIGNTVEGAKACVFGVAAGIVIVPAAGLLAALVQAMILGGNADDAFGIALGLGLAVALIEVPLLVLKRHRRRSFCMEVKAFTD